VICRESLKDGSKATVHLVVAGDDSNDDHLTFNAYDDRFIGVVRNDRFDRRGVKLDVLAGHLFSSLPCFINLADKMKYIVDYITSQQNNKLTI
jgi:hypothetical protein